MAASNATSHEVHSEVGGRGVLQRWFRAQGVSSEGVRKVVQLCDPAYLEAQRRPTSWNRRGSGGHQDRLRYLWYRHAARLLGWCERHQFPAFVRDILREEIYPSLPIDNEEARTGATTLGRPNTTPPRTHTERDGLQLLHNQSTVLHAPNQENRHVTKQPKHPRKPRAKKVGDVALPDRLPLLQLGANDVDPQPKKKRVPKSTAKRGPLLQEGDDRAEGTTVNIPVKKPRKPRQTKAKIQSVALQMSAMPSPNSPNDIGPPLPNSTPWERPRGRNGRWRRDQKGKAVVTREKKPKNWISSPVIPNETKGVVTRAKAAANVEYEQQRHNDEFIREVLSHFPEEDDDLFNDSIAPESQHTVGSMDTRNVNLWESIFREEAWRCAQPIHKAPGFGSTHPGGTFPSEKPAAVVTGEVPAHLRGVYGDWSSARSGWAVLVPNRFLSEDSFHSGYTPTWTQGHVVGEGVDFGTGQKKVVCELGGFPSEYHMNEDEVRIALTPHAGAVGSEGGHGYGWGKRQHVLPGPEPAVFPTTADTELLDDFLLVVGEGTGGLNGNGDAAGMQSVEGPSGPGLTEHVRDNSEHQRIAPQPLGQPIGDFDFPSDVEGAEGTQDSTTRTTFPKVRFSLPEYMLGGDILSGSDDVEDDLELRNSDADSSDQNWMPSYEDAQESGDSDFEVDLVDPSFEHDDGLTQWCMRPESFAPRHMEIDELAAYYRKSSWNSASVEFIGSRDNFSGHAPGLNCPHNEGIPPPERVFNLYWTDEVLDRIVIETNRYARAIVPHEPNKPPRTKGGPTWVDVDRLEIRGWIGICILMGCKKLPSLRHYWMKSESLLYCEVIAEVMTRIRFQQILSCLHLVDNSQLVQDVKNPQFDRIAKTRWLIEHFCAVSKQIYNLDREITVDECVIPYKGRYCFIRQFMPDKPVRFGIKVWLLASSKSRFVWNIEVYFGEGTGSGPNGLGYHVVERMVSGLKNRGHHLVIDNLFASVNLFHNLMVNGIWATGTVRRTSKNLPAGLYRDEDNEVRGSMLIRNHIHRQIGVVSWQDKKLVTLLSTAVASWVPGVKVLRRIPGIRGQLIVPSSPMHEAYVEYMRGVDVTDHLRGNYSTQLRSHKWWIKLFHFVVDQSMVNAYVTWIKEMEDLGLRIMPHLAFKIAIGKYLAKGVASARQRRAHPPARAPRRPALIHAPFHSNLRRTCVVCGHLQRWYCEACGKKWMCRSGCYYAHHAKLNK